MLQRTGVSSGSQAVMAWRQCGTIQKLTKAELRAIYILRKDIRVVGGPENGNFPLLYVVKMSLRSWVGG